MTPDFLFDTLRQDARNAQIPQVVCNLSRRELNRISMEDSGRSTNCGLPKAIFVDIVRVEPTFQESPIRILISCRLVVQLKVCPSMEARKQREEPCTCGQWKLEEADAVNHNLVVCGPAS